MEELTPEEKKLNTCRQKTAEAIIGVAETKFRLEQVRKDPLADPRVIQQAAQNYRQAEQIMKDMIDKEILAVTDMVIERVAKVIKEGG